jgi:hypothetical protein
MQVPWAVAIGGEACRAANVPPMAIKRKGLALQPARAFRSIEPGGWHMQIKQRPISNHAGKVPGQNQNNYGDKRGAKGKG